MEHIYHEKQEGMMCAQHSLNNLLQSKYFTEFDLATIANQIDQQEREKMAEGGKDSEDYRRFLKDGSKNMDDSGYFSIEVIIKALKVWNLDIIRYNSKHDIAIKAQNDPTTQNAYILNFKHHWLTIRKIGQQYFNLNSLLPSPQLLSTSYLHLFLHQLQQEGYSIFIVVGELPICEADEILKNRLVEPNTSNITSQQTGPLKLKIKKSKDNEDDSLNQAIQESLQSYEDDDKNLNLAISLSLGMQSAASTSRQTPEEIQDLENLEKAIRMSMEN